MMLWDEEDVIGQGKCKRYSIRPIPGRNKFGVYRDRDTRFEPDYEAKIFATKQAGEHFLKTTPSRTVAERNAKAKKAIRDGAQKGSVAMREMVEDINVKIPKKEKL
jgi:hypothetical protein